MHLQNIFDLLFIVKTKAPKEVLKFLVYYQKKFKRKRPIFQQGSEIYSILVRNHRIGTIGIKISSQMPKRLSMFTRTGIIRFNYRAAKLCRKAGCGMKFPVFVTETPMDNNGLSMFKAPHIRILRTNLEDLINFARVVRDLLLYFEKERLLITGLLTYVFSPSEPYLYLLSTEIELDSQVNFLVFRDSRFIWSPRLGKLELREIPLIRLEGVAIYNVQITKESKS